MGHPGDWPASGGEEAERAETVVDGHDDHAVTHQRGRVLVVALTSEEGAAMDPHQDGQMPARRARPG